MKRNQDGFSMVEVMVASMLMVIVVMMLGMLFNQTSQAWRTGKQRVNMFKDVRALFGPIQRDASAAVDISTIPQDIRNLLGGGDQLFSGGSLAFYTLTGTGFRDNPGNKPINQGSIPRRAFSYVTYSGGTRTEQWIDEGGSPRTLTESSVGCTFRPFWVDANGNLTSGQPVGASRFPSFVTLKMSANSAEGEQEGKKAMVYDIGAASAGADRIFGEGVRDPNGKDDIRTWVSQ
ncbi:MAG: prepilin-type N-terminal cleavage/methylation domain-containing protein [Kiritimatiellaeota bacterium]|nr:prepilin-type N-terminal cleavage/methylation domain-containing protein [Kiritimatiellota bacterium]